MKVYRFMTKKLTGTVVSTKMKKTILVVVERKYTHPIYRKVLVRHRKYKVHNEDEKIKEGDLVTFREIRPISKEVSFEVVKESLKK